jgi:hypothetical protein
MPQAGTTDEKALAAGRAAGYCWAAGPGGRGRCTRPPRHQGEHMDYYNGRKAATDVVGYRWPR